MNTGGRMYPIFFFSSVIGLYNRMYKVVKHTNNRGTVSSDANAVLAITHWKLVKEITIWLRKTVCSVNDGKWDTNLSGNVSGINNPLDCFNIENIENIEDYNIDQWDKTHTTVIIGSFNINWNIHAMQFYHGTDGNFIGIGDDINGTING